MAPGPPCRLQHWTVPLGSSRPRERRSNLGKEMSEPGRRQPPNSGHSARIARSPIADVPRASLCAIPRAMESIGDIIPDIIRAASDWVEDRYGRFAAWAAFFVLLVVVPVIAIVLVVTLYSLGGS